MDKLPVMLIVDDIEVNREMLKNIFMDAYQIIEFGGGKEAIHYLKDNNEIAVILLDIRMPEIDGFEVLHYIRTNPNLMAVPVVMITEAGEEKVEIKALSLGASDFITKPYNPEIIRRRVKNIVTNDKYEICRRFVERDQLTNIYNSVKFYKKTAEMLYENKDSQYVLITWSIPRFKIINELFGIAAGNEVLKKFASAFEERLKGIGTYGRLSEDNFVICFPYSMFDLEYFKNILDKGVSIIGENYDVDLAIGIYVIDDITLPVENMCERASLALRTLKNNYMNKYAFYDDQIRKEFLEEQQMITEMNDALESGQFCVFYQPIFSASYERPISAEALVRWEHPEKGLISPTVFIPVFEKNGLVMKMDYFVWEEVCKFLRAELDAEHQVVPISVNVSRMNLYSPNLCKNIIALIEQYRLDPSLLKLEITESAYTDNPNQLLSAISSFQRYGLQIYMDDFGSGYSSLNMLKNVPVDILKIDREFINELDESARAGSVLNSVVRMAKWLEMDVVAEGVETKAQLEFLRSVGCDRIQGYYFSKPLPKDKFSELINSFKFTERMGKADKAFQVMEYNSYFRNDKGSKGILAGMVGAMGVYELFDNTLEIVRVNKAYYEITGSSPKTLFTDTKNATNWIFEEDRELLIRACEEAELTKNVSHCLLRRYHQTGRMMLNDYRVKYIGKKGKRSLFCIVFHEVTDLFVEKGKNLYTEMFEKENRACETKNNKENINTKKKYSSSEQNLGSYGKKILIVDDNQVNRAILRKILADTYEVLEAENGQKALEIAEAEAQNIVAVLLDIVMPIMNGYEFLKERNKNKTIASVPVIVLSQAENREAEIKALECGASDFLKKPYEPIIIKRRIENLVKLHDAISLLSVEK